MKKINDYNLNLVARVDFREGFLNGKAIKRVIFFLRSIGCSWARERSGGCSMCGHIQGTLKGSKLNSENVITQFVNEYIKINFKQFPMLCIYNAGSFLNDDEIPLNAQKIIFKLISKNEYIKCIVVESRPEYITNEKLKLIKDILPDKRLEIGIGLESINDVIRDLCVNKGFFLEDFKKALEKIKKYDNIYSLAYVLLKPAFLTEAEAIDDSIETIKWCDKNGVNIISLEPVSVQRCTLIDYLHENNFYKVPRLWSVLEILNKIKDLKILVRVGGFEFHPSPKIFVENCKKCTYEILKCISEFNKSNNYEIFYNLPEKVKECPCKQEWDLLINQDIDKSIIERIFNYLN